MNNNSWYKKEKPLLGLLGTGGGAAQVTAPGASGPIDATGGTKATPGDGYIYHLFTSSGSLTINSGGADMDVLIVGGGGGGGFDRGGGGGAGAFRPETLAGVPGTHPITIGAGGEGGSGSPGSTNGGNTTLTYNSTPYIAGGGGGGGGTGGSPGPGKDGTYGGSGGGSGYNPPGAAGAVGGPAPYTPYGNPGKMAVGPLTSGGAGGGAGSGSSPTVSNPYPYTGPSPYAVVEWNYCSDGKTLPWIPTAYGEDGNFCGGGGAGGDAGCGAPATFEPVAQKAGAGKGGSPTVTSGAAQANTGSGGGGGAGGSPHNGKDGSNGVVLIRYSA